MSTTIISPSVFAGLVVPYDLESDIDASTAGQSGPIAGSAIPSEDAAGRTPGLQLGTSGAQTATTTLHVATQRAGNIDRATYRARRTVSGATDARWRGANLPNMISGFSGFGWDSGVIQAYPDAETLSDDSQVVVYTQRPNAPDEWSIRAQVWSPTTETYSAVSMQTGLDKDHAPWPFVLPMPDPQTRNASPVLIAGYWVADDANAVANVDLKISRDGGANWSSYAEGVLPSDISTTGRTLGKLSAAMVGAQMVLFAHTTDASGTYETIDQYASSNMGASFDSVGTIGDGTKPSGYPDVTSVGNVAVLAWGYDTTIRLSVIRNAHVLVTTYESSAALGQVVSASSATGTITFAAFSVTRLDSSRVCLPYIYCSSNQRRGAAIIYDLTTDQTFTASINAGYWHSDGKATATEYFQHLSATTYRGQVRLYCNPVSSTATYENKLTRLNLGGLTTVTMPSLQRTSGYFDRAMAWDQTYVPAALPTGYTGWAATGAGADDITTTEGRHRITTTANTRYYSRSPAVAPSDATKQVTAIFQLWQVSGGSVSAREGTVALRYAYAGKGYEVEVRCSATQIRSYDVNGAATISTASIAVSSGIEILMALAGAGKVSIYYRLLGADEDGNFQVLDDQTSVTDDAGAGGTVCVYRYGALSVSTATFEYVPLAQNVVTTYGVDDWATAEVNPNTLRGIPYGDGTYALAGVKLTATAGPTLAGDAWTIYPDATYHYRMLLPAGDPESAAHLRGGRRVSSRDEASTWRSTATSGYVAFRRRDGHNRIIIRPLVFHEEGLNVGTYAAVAYNEDTASWVTLGTADKRKTGLRFTRANATSCRVNLDTGNASSTEPYFIEGELAGGWWKDASGNVRRILWNAEGRWSSDGDAAAPYLDLDPDQMTGLEDTTGSCEIWYPRSTFVYYPVSTEKYSKFGIWWSGAQTTYSGDLRANILAIGEALCLPMQRAWGTIQTMEDQSTITEFRSGLRTSSRRRIAPRRQATLPLTGPQEQGHLLDPSAGNPRPYKASSSASMAYIGSQGDGYGKVLGAWVRAAGSGVPIVYVHRLARGTPDSYTLVGHHAVGIYGRMTQAPRFTDTLGRDTGNVHGAIYVGENLVVSEEL